MVQVTLLMQPSLYCHPLLIMCTIWYGQSFLSVSYILTRRILSLAQLSIPFHFSCPPIQIVSRPVLRNYTWQLFHSFKADPPYMEHVHCKVILTLKPSALKLWSSLWKYCPGHCSENINGNCFIFSGHINLTLLVYYDILTFDFDLQPSPSKYCSAHCLDQNLYFPSQLTHISRHIYLPDILTSNF